MGRNKQERTNLHARVALDTADKLKQIAFRYGYVHGAEGSIGELLDAIAEEEIFVSFMPNSENTDNLQHRVAKLEEFKNLFQKFLNSTLSD